MSVNESNPACFSKDVRAISIIVQRPSFKGNNFPFFPAPDGVIQNCDPAVTALQDPSHEPSKEKKKKEKKGEISFFASIGRKLDRIRLISTRVRARSCTRRDVARDELKLGSVRMLSFGLISRVSRDQPS